MIPLDDFCSLCSHTTNLEEVWMNICSPGYNQLSVLSMASSQRCVSSLILMLIISCMGSPSSRLQSTSRSIISSNPHQQHRRSEGNNYHPSSPGENQNPGRYGTHPSACRASRSILRAEARCTDLQASHGFFLGSVARPFVSCLVNAT